MNNLPVNGPLNDNEIEVFEKAGILTEGGCIAEVGLFDTLAEEAKKNNCSIEEINSCTVAMPGFIDPHTHICWAGNRANDYSMRLEGKTYPDIAKSGGGIISTVEKTRNANADELAFLTADRAKRMLNDGVTTIEVKSGYGLTGSEEIKILQAIKKAGNFVQADLIPTCLAAHIKPYDFEGSNSAYLNFIVNDLLPEIYEKGLANRVDIYCDEMAFKPKEALDFLMKAKDMGFELTIHADQFTIGGSEVAAKVGAVSADHLEVSGIREIKLLAAGSVVPVALPASSVGLGTKFAPARKLLNAGASLAIGSDWNPGTAPMGDLLICAAILGVFEKLTNAETLAAITFRAAAALDLKDRGIIKKGNIADFIAFELNDYREILYNQGKIKPNIVWKNGIPVK